MNEDITPRRGAVRSSSRPLAARPLTVAARQSTAPSPIAPVSSLAPVDEPNAGGTEEFAAEVSQLPPLLPVQPIMVDVPTTSAAQPLAPSRPASLQDVIVVPKVVKRAAVAEAEMKPDVMTVAEMTPPQPPTMDAPEQALVPTPSTSKKKPFFKRLFKRSSLTMLAIVLILGATGYISVDAWLTNNKLKSQLTTAPTASVAQAATKHQQVNEGTDTTPLPVNTLASYKTAADAPRALTITKLGVAARIMPMGLNKDNSMQSPVNINDSGWYTGSAKPGTTGAMVIDGHSSATNSAEHLGLFNNLDSLTNGDIVSIEKGDGSKLSYKVVFKETVKLDAIDMHKVMLPYGTATEGLNLITCAGQWNAKNTTLDHRTVVYTERIY